MMIHVFRDDAAVCIIRERIEIRDTGCLYANSQTLAIDRYADNGLMLIRLTTSSEHDNH